MNNCEMNYRDWLVDQVNIIEGLDYGPLLRELFRIEFYWTVSYDEDRAMDGIALRGDFEDQFNLSEPVYMGPARVLEVLIGIAKRVEFQLFGGPYMDKWPYSKIFWDFIWNLELFENMYGALSDEKYDKIVTFVTFFMERKKNCHKKCNIFGLDNGDKNVQKMNFWAQMMLYVRQKWPK